MRKVRFPNGHLPPADWLAEAEAASVALEEAQTDAEREAIIEAKQKIWRDDRIRNWLLGLFHSKCWYSEAQEAVSAYHVDHYRPKGRVTDVGRTHPEPGYWWLAFRWQNYRICGQLVNVKKNDVFPLVSGHRATPDAAGSIKLEAPALLDPITDDARLVSFEMDEDGCRAVASGGADEEDRARVVTTIEVIGLNRLDRLNRKRADVWEECRQKLVTHAAASGEPPAMKLLQRALIVVDLKKRVAYESELSSVAEACVRKLGSELVCAQVFG
jgi:hypothetical protein